MAPRLCGAEAFEKFSNAGLATVWGEVGRHLSHEGHAPVGADALREVEGLSGDGGGLLDLAGLEEGASLAEEEDPAGLVPADGEQGQPFVDPGTCFGALPRSRRHCPASTDRSAVLIHEHHDGGGVLASVVMAVSAAVRSR